MTRWPSRWRATLAGYLPRILASVEDGRARRTAQTASCRGWWGVLPGGRVVARALRGLVEGGRHQEVLGFILVKLREAMREKEGLA